MSTQWLTVRSFQQCQDLLAAINTVSIHLKLGLAGVKDQERETEAKDARDVLRTFLNELDGFILALGDKGNRPVTGTDARTRQLARSFVQARRDRGHYKSQLFSSSPLAVRDMLDSPNPKTQTTVLESLEELRTLLEAHIHNDSRMILGEL